MEKRTNSTTAQCTHIHFFAKHFISILIFPSLSLSQCIMYALWFSVHRRSFRLLDTHSTLKVLWKITVILAPISILNFKAHTTKTALIEFSQLLHFLIYVIPIGRRRQKQTNKQRTHAHITHTYIWSIPHQTILNHWNTSTTQLKKKQKKKRRTPITCAQLLRHYLLKLF